jgi:uncharacterized protein DUF4349
MQSAQSFRIALCVVLVTVLIACSRQEQAAEASRDAAAPAPASVSTMEAQSAASAPAKASAAVGARDDNSTHASLAAPPTEVQLTSSAATYADAQRRFIRTAQANFRVADVYQSALAIEDAVAAQGGFVVRNEIAADVQEVQRRPKGDGKLIELAEYTVRGNLSVRVPSGNAQAFLRGIVKQMEFLDRRSFEAADAQFAMLRQQLAQQRNQETQQELGHATQQGGKLGHKVQSIAARSDAKSARDEASIAKKEFEDRVAFATIDLSLYQLSKIRQTELADVEAVFQANSPGFLPRLGSSLRTGWYGVLEVFIQLVKLWPLWLLIVLSAFAYRRLRKR